MRKMVAEVTKTKKTAVETGTKAHLADTIVIDHAVGHRQRRQHPPNKKNTKRMPPGLRPQTSNQAGTEKRKEMRGEERETARKSPENGPAAVTGVMATTNEVVRMTARRRRRKDTGMKQSGKPRAPRPRDDTLRGMRMRRLRLRGREESNVKERRRDGVSDKHGQNYHLIMTALFEETNFFPFFLFPFSISYNPSMSFSLKNAGQVFPSYPCFTFFSTFLSQRRWQIFRYSCPSASFFAFE